MVYIRAKKINKGEYAYLVESIKTPKGSRQKVKEYLGKIHSITKEPISVTSNSMVSKKDFLREMTISLLTSAGFTKSEKVYVFEKLLFDPEQMTLVKCTKTSHKNAVISINEGYLCSFTLQRLLLFKPTKNLMDDAKNLAKFFLEAGFLISQEDFVQFYQL